MKEYKLFNFNLESDNMNKNIMNREMLNILCAKSVGMALGDNLHRDEYLVALHK